MMSGAWFPPDMTLAIQAKEFNLCFIRPEHFVSPPQSFTCLLANSRRAVMCHLGTLPCKPDYWSAAEMVVLLEGSSLFSEKRWSFVRTGGYEVEQFVDTPDDDLICVICRAVLRCPVRLKCNHVFCKECILQWMKRQVKCPCCRQPIDQNQMLVLFKLSKSIGRLSVKCRNAQQGCRATFPLSNEYLHVSNCPYEWQLCPHEGCGQQVLRKDAQTHDQSCSYWRQLCPMGCGTLLVRKNQAQHNCYRELQQRYVAERRKQRAIAANLRRKMQRMQSRMAQIRRQINLMCESLEVGDLEIEAGEGTSTWTDANAASPSSSRRHHTNSSRVRYM
ncbi:RING finger protein 151 [Pseudorasbora parva]|uniref:RING finger protein 151 n=1 Tax=Pseudorasbora parva TaxID=51549 RepID=UPI00351EF7BF